MRIVERNATELLTGPTKATIDGRRVPAALGRAIILSADEIAAASLPWLVLQAGLQPISIASLAHLRLCRSNLGVSVVLCEERLPDGTFRDALQVVDGFAREAPVIVFSRFAEWETYLEAVRFGAYDCLRYPFRRGELQRVIGRLFENRSAEANV